MAKIRKLLSLLLCLVMVLSFFPAAYAEGENEGMITEEQGCDHDHEHDHECEDQGTIAPVEEEPVGAIHESPDTEPAEYSVGDGVLDVPETDEADEEHDGLVRVKFICDPEDAIITVYDPSQTNENGEPLVIGPEEDESYQLFPGEYLYDAECEGYLNVRKVKFEIYGSEREHKQIVVLSRGKILHNNNVIMSNVSNTFLNNCSASYKIGQYYSNLVAVSLSGNPSSDLVSVANSQIGYHEGNSWDDISGSSTGTGNYTEYNKWYGVGTQAWCNLFVSWCCTAAGISTSIAPKNPFYLDKWQSCGAKVYSWKDYVAGTVTPKAGDIIIFGSATTNNKAGSELSMSTKHIGIITGYSNGTFYTVEGNISDKVNNRSYSPNSSTGFISSSNYVHAIVQPKYNQCSHQYETVYDGEKYRARCSKCGTEYQYQPTFTTESAGIYHVTSEYNLNSEPYPQSQTGIIYSTGRQFSAVGHVINAYGDKWYKTNDGYYVYSIWAELVQLTSNLSINPAKTSYTIQQGSSCDIQGSITSNYNITKVTATLDGNQYVNLTPNSKSVNIGATGSGQINSFKGSALSVGTHYLVINATDASPKTMEKTVTINVMGSAVPATYTVHYDANGGEGAPANQTKTQGTTLMLSSEIPLRTMYVFRGWSTSSTGDVQYQPGGSYTLDEDVTLYAVWEKGTYTISYDANGGTGAPPIQTFTYSSGERFSTIVPTREGYTFINWKDDFFGNYYNPGDLIPDSWGNNTLRAQWQINYYTLDINSWIDEVQGWEISGYGSFDLYINGNLVMADGDDYFASWPYGTTYELKNIRLNDGYSFDGFLTDASISYAGSTNRGRAGIITDNTSVNIMLHTCPASIGENPEPEVFISHTYYYYSTPVTWYEAKLLCENMGGHLVTVSSEEENSFLVELVGKRFKEESGCYIWLGATDRDSEGNWKWVNDELFSYTKWFAGEPNNSTDTDEGAENFAHFYTWNGDWNDICGNTKMPFVCEIDTSSYVIRYDANGGTGAPGSQTKTYDVALKLSDTKPTRPSASAGSYTVTLDPNGGSVSSTKLTAARTTSYTFKNWNTAANGSGTAYNPGANYTANANVTLYAQWNSSTTTAAMTLPTPTREGYSFKGWATSAAATSGTTGSYTPSGDVTLYAIWEQTTAGNLEILSVTGHPGKEILVPVRLSSNPGLYTINFHVNFDSTVLQLTGVEDGSLTGWSYSSKSSYIHWETQEDKDQTAAGEIVKLRFLVLETAADGATALSIDDVEAMNRNEKWFSFTLIPGEVTVSSRIAGDGNHDGKVDILDLVRLRKYIMHDTSDINTSNADVTGDGLVNSADLIRLRRYLAGDPQAVLN